jgi:hypothetical protein
VARQPCCLGHLPRRGRQVPRHIWAAGPAAGQPSGQPAGPKFARRHHEHRPAAAWLPRRERGACRARARTSFSAGSGPGQAPGGPHQLPGERSHVREIRVSAPFFTRTGKETEDILDVPARAGRPGRGACSSRGPAVYLAWSCRIPRKPAARDKHKRAGRRRASLSRHVKRHLPMSSWFWTACILMGRRRLEE